MSDFGKIIDGKIYYAPNILNKDGKQYINPTDDLYLEFGYLPMEYTVVPEMKAGFHVVSSWIEYENKLIQKWNYEVDDDIADYIKRINDLEETVKQLIKQVSDQSTEKNEDNIS